MKRKPSIGLSVVFAAGLVLTELPQALAQTLCWAEVQALDVRVDVSTNGEIRRSARSVVTQAFGVPGPIVVDPARPTGFLMQVDLHGSGDFEFTYSGEIGRVRIRVDGKLFHDGPPVRKLTAKPGLFRVEMEARGDIQFRVATAC